MKKIKIVFLDLDGVLNVIGQGRDEYGSLFHQHFVDNLGTIIQKTNAKIVLSSAWRKSGLAIIQEMWKDRKLPGEIIDVTPSLYIQKNGGIVFWNNKLTMHPTERIHGISIPRGVEIQYWLDNEAKEHVESYVILDDDDDMLYTQRDNFVCCSGNFTHKDCIDLGYGLTKKCMQKAIKILNNNG